ncbi:Glutaminase kidney [Paragonimus heterotremus]|uniref:glutaminase n=1 Tax=Paragonimus heterotremus TaxID=100268 RepID=A0A8J4T7L0_9TREM|nr:Glutaminase kidney [Paragonimus heterotremus]
MKENRCFPEQTNLRELVDFYLQICSIEGNCDAVAVMAGTLANGGINPLTGARLVNAAAARDTLSVMHSCGMYDYSGQFAFKVGLPCKSGVSGVILAVVPDLMGLALFSPLIDRHGNSVRGVQFCQELIQRFIFHHYESQLHTDKKLDPRKPRDAHRFDAIASLLFAAENNDLATLRRSYISGVDFSAVDYDGRTGLHVAASSGARDAVKFFIEVGGVNPNPVDRWGHTPLSEAVHFNHTDVVEYLENYFIFQCSQTTQGLIHSTVHRDIRQHTLQQFIQRLGTEVSFASHLVCSVSQSDHLPHSFQIAVEFTKRLVQIHYYYYSQ